MPTARLTAALLIAVMTISSADVTRAGCFDWLYRRQTQNVNYAPTTVGYFPNGVYQSAGPAAAYYTTNYAPNYQPAPAPTAAAAAAPNTVYRAPLNGYYAAPTTTFYRAPRTTYYRAPTATYYRTAPAGYAPNSFYTPTTTNYAPSGYTSNVPVTAYQPVQPAPQRSWFGGLFRWGTACDGTSSCRPYTATGVNYAAPRTTFRPVWRRVPVTYYRPVTSVDPVTGQTVQRMQPCTTYRYQIQQRPALIPQRQAPVVQQGVPCEPTPAPAAGSSSVRSDDPYYNRSRIMRPGEDAGSLIPKDAEILRDERVPADDRPRLGGSRPDAEASSLDRANTRRTASTREAPPQRRPAATTTERPGLMLDPNADDDNYPQAPPLLSPRDKTAFRPLNVQRVAYQAQWPRTKPSVRRASETRRIPTLSIQSPKPARRQPTRKLDDSGWRSLRD